MMKDFKCFVGRYCESEIAVVRDAMTHGEHSYDVLFFFSFHWQKDVES